MVVCIEVREIDVFKFVLKATPITKSQLVDRKIFKVGQGRENGSN